jgi:hypothetical protein
MKRMIKHIESMTKEDLKELEERVQRDDEEGFTMDISHLAPLDHLGLTGNIKNDNKE